MTVNNDNFFVGFVKALFEEKRPVDRNVRHEISDEDFNQVIAELLNEANKTPDSHLNFHSTVFKEGEGYTSRPIIIHDPDRGLGFFDGSFSEVLLNILFSPVIGVYHLSRVIKNDTMKDNRKDFLVAYLEMNKDHMHALKKEEIVELENKFGLNKKKVDGLYNEAISLQKERFGVISDEEYNRFYHERHIAPLTGRQNLEISEKEYRELFTDNRVPITSSHSNIPSEDEYRRLYHSADAANAQFKNKVNKPSSPTRWKEDLKHG